jgi:hypothetical protein
MPVDRMIFYESPGPTREQVHQVLLDFLGGVGEAGVGLGGESAVKWDHDRFYVRLPGRNTWALRRIFPDSPRALYTHPERWIEVWMSDGAAPGVIDVMTREQDYFTMALAEGIAVVLAKPFDGVREVQGVGVVEPRK